MHLDEYVMPFCISLMGSGFTIVIHNVLSPHLYFQIRWYRAFLLFQSPLQSVTPRKVTTCEQ